MADTFYGVNATKVHVNSPADLAEGIDKDVKIMYDSFALSTDVFAQDDVVKLGAKIPAGRVVGVQFKTPDLGGASTVDIGHEANGVESASAAAFASNVDISGQAVNAYYPVSVALSAPTQIALHFDGATATTSGTIELMVFYIPN